MMVDWNVPLKLGLAGLAVAVLCAGWFAVRAVLNQSVPRGWLVGLGILLLVSAVTTFGSQVTVVSKLSASEADAPHD